MSRRIGWARNDPGYVCGKKIRKMYLARESYSVISRTMSDYVISTRQNLYRIFRFPLAQAAGSGKKKKKKLAACIWQGPQLHLLYFGFSIWGLEQRNMLVKQAENDDFTEAQEIAKLVIAVGVTIIPKKPTGQKFVYHSSPTVSLGHQQIWILYSLIHPGWPVSYKYFRR